MSWDEPALQASGVASLADMHTPEESTMPDATPNVVGG
jgi:hypothetical protein